MIVRSGAVGAEIQLSREEAQTGRKTPHHAGGWA